MMLYKILLVLSVVTLSLGFLSLTVIAAFRNVLDVNGDRIIDREDVRVFLTSCDRNGDGRVSFVEFSARLGVLNVLFIGVEAVLFVLFSPAILVDIVINDVVANIDLGVFVGLGL